MAHELTIEDSIYYIFGNDTHTLIHIAKVIGLKYDNLEKSKLSETQSLIKVWKIGELNDYLKIKQCIHI